jgi:hypothetical protein
MSLWGKAQTQHDRQPRWRCCDRWVDLWRAKYPGAMNPSDLLLGPAYAYSLQHKNELMQPAALVDVGSESRPYGRPTCSRRLPLKLFGDNSTRWGPDSCRDSSDFLFRRAPPIVMNAVKPDLPADPSLADRQSRQIMSNVG